MDLTVAWWIALAGGALVAGGAVTGALVAPRRAEALFATLGILGASLSVASLAAITGTIARPDAAVYAFAFILGFGGGGYALASSVLLQLAPSPGTPAVTEAAQRSARPHVIIVRCVEPRAYGFRSTALMLAGLVEEGLLEPSVGNLPLLFFAQKARYRLAGGTSPGEEELTRIADRLQVSLRELDPVVTWATCGGPNRLASRVAHALSAGYTRILVVDLALVSGSHYEAALREAERIASGVPGASLAAVTAFGDEDALVRMLAGRIQGESPARERTGVVIAVQGQPRVRAERDPSSQERELAFACRLQGALHERGFLPDSVRTAWSEWGDPDITTELRHLAALGCQRILVVPATRPVESLATRTDLPAAIRAAHLDPEIDVTIMPAWGADPTLIASLAARARGILAAEADD